MKINNQEIYYSAKNSLAYAITNEQYDSFVLVVNEVKKLLASSSKDKDIQQTERKYLDNFFLHTMFEIAKNLYEKPIVTDDSIEKENNRLKSIEEKQDLVCRVFEYFHTTELVTQQDILYFCFTNAVATKKHRDSNGVLNKEDPLVNHIITCWQRDCYLHEDSFKHMFDIFTEDRHHISYYIKELEQMFNEQETIYIHNKLHSTLSQDKKILHKNKI